MSRKQWVALIRGSNWTVGKVSRNLDKMTVYHLTEFNFEPLTSRENNKGSILDESKESSQEQAEDNKNEYFANLKKWLKKQRIPLKKLKIALSCPGVITRVITIPELKKKDLEKLLTQQVDQYFTLDVSDYVIDYRILEKVEEDGQKRLRVLLVAIPLPEWEKQWDLWTNIGFTPKVTDFAADCICRLYRRLSGWDDKKDHVPVSDLAIIDLGKDRVEFILMEHGVFFLFSDMEIDLGDLNFAQKTSPFSEPDVASQSLSSENTQEYGGNLELDEPTEPVEPLEIGRAQESDISPGFEVFQEYGTSIISVKEEGRSQGQEEILDTSRFSEQRVGFLHGENEIIQEQDELENRLFPVFNALREFFNFFASRHFGKTVNQIFLTGECADYPGLEEIFQRNVEIPIRVGFPGEWKPKFKKKVRDKEGQWMKYASLYGLAIRED